MPTFAILTGPYACMNGNHAAPWFADAWFKGIRNFDLPTAYEGLRKRSLEALCCHGASVRKRPSTTSTPIMATCRRSAPEKRKPCPSASL